MSLTLIDRCIRRVAKKVSNSGFIEFADAYQEGWKAILELELDDEFCLKNKARVYHIIQNKMIDSLRKEFKHKGLDRKGQWANPMLNNPLNREDENYVKKIEDHNLAQYIRSNILVKFSKLDNDILDFYCNLDETETGWQSRYATHIGCKSGRIHLRLHLIRKRVAKFLNET